MDANTPSAPTIINTRKSFPKLLIIVIILLVLILAGLLLFFFWKNPFNLNNQTQSNLASSTENESSGSADLSATSSDVQKATTLAVTIDEVLDGNLNATASPPAVPETKQYKILLDKDTEIIYSAIFDDSSKPVKKNKLPVSVLTAGKQIVVYTNVDVYSSNTLKAVKIEVIPSDPK